MQRRTDVLVLGCEGAGKTLLIKQLNNYCAGLEIDGGLIETLPSVGVELHELVFRKKHKMLIREVGGSLVLTWNRFVRDCSMLMFVVDSCDPTQVAPAFLEFCNLLSMEELKRVPFLLLFNKTDSPCTMQLTDLFHVPGLLEQINSGLERGALPRLEVMSCSAYEYRNFEAILEWIVKHQTGNDAE